MTAKHTHYVAGLMFSKTRSFVALICRKRPAWMAGKLNGIGGKVEAEESAAEAMFREFGEAAGYWTHGWSWFAELTGKSQRGDESFRVDWFTGVGELSKLSTKTDEPIVVIPVGQVYGQRRNMVENLPWLIFLALDHLANGRPAFATAQYP